MKAIPLLFLAGVALAQQPLPSRPAPGPAARQQPAGRANPAFDSTVAAVGDVGIKVAEARSMYSLYRRSAYNEPDGVLIERAVAYGGSCRALADAVRHAQRVICRSCMSRSTQPAVDQYRVYLPSLLNLANTCATRMQTLKARGTPAQQSAALRADVLPAGNRLALGLRQYEVRLHEVRVAMGWAPPANLTAQPRRGS